jgi:hypothetical protein
LKQQSLGRNKEFQHFMNITYKTQDIADDSLTQARKKNQINMP